MHALLRKLRLLTPTSKRQMLLRTLGVQAIILSVAGFLLLRHFRELEIESLQSFMLRHNEAALQTLGERVVQHADALASDSAGFAERFWSLANDSEPHASGTYLLCLPDGELAILSDPSHTGPNTSLRRQIQAFVAEQRAGAHPSDIPISQHFRCSDDHYFATAQHLADGTYLLLVQPESTLLTTFSRSVAGAFAHAALAGILALGLTCLLSLAIMRQYESEIERLNASLAERVRQEVGLNVQRLHALIFGLAKLADFRDSDTGSHLERIADYSAVLAAELRGECPEIDDAWIADLRLASSLHDIGKVGVPDVVLLKPGKLTDEERAVIEQHPIFGADTLIAIRERLGDSSLINMAIQITLGHHERWDGAGYPYGLEGEQIGLSARIVAVADVYDALRSARVYKQGMSHAEAAARIIAGSGSHFDPQVVAAFKRCQIAIEQLSQRWTTMPIAISHRLAA